MSLENLNIMVSYYPEGSVTMLRLNLPTYSFTLKSEGGRELIFDKIRKKYVVLTPEEWVRQHFVWYLVNEKSYPASLISIEKHFTYNKLSKRIDVLVYNRNASPVLMVECKSPDIRISQKVFDQIALYNLQFALRFLVVTNGMNHFCCMLDPEEGSYRYLKEIPEFNSIAG